jgi:hypothetical protein
MKKIILLFLSLISAYAFSQTPFISNNSDTAQSNHGFKYWIGNSNPPSDWNQINFDDAQWNYSSTAAVIGYGWPTLPKNYVTIRTTTSLYMRIPFNVSDVSLFGALSFLADYDDGFIAYLNGKEIIRVNLGKKGDAVTYNRVADRSHESHIYRNYFAPVDGFYIDASVVNSALQEGDNVFAIEIHNDSINGSDLSFLCNVYNLKTNNWYDIYNAAFRYYRQVDFDSSKFPLVMVETDQYGIPALQQRVIAGIKIIDHTGNKRLSDSSTFKSRISIERRGESSAWFPKMSYNVETQNADGSNNNVSIMDMPAENDWVLFSSFTDKSYIRNELIFILGRRMNHYEPRTHFCELFYNGEYMGLYYFMEKIKRDKNRVNVAKRDSLFPANGGYVFKYDKPTRKQVQFIYPKDDEVTPGEINYLNSYIANFEKKLSSDKFLDPVEGYRNYINPYSLIDYIIINELSKNCDAYLYSTYFYKDKQGPINYGPLWDYDLAFGGASYQEGNLTNKWQFEYNTDLYIKLMLRDTTLKNALVNRWRELRNNLISNDNLMFLIDSLTGAIYDSRIMNYKVWPVEDKFIFGPDHYSSSYDDEINQLKSWLGNRLSWIDANIGNIFYPLDINAPTFAYSNTAIEVFPNPFTDLIKIHLLGPSGYYSIRIQNIDGKLIENRTFYCNEGIENELTVSSISLANAPAGMYILTVQHNGATVQAEKLIKK